MNPASPASAAWYGRLPDHMTLPPRMCPRSYFSRSGPIRTEQLAQMSPRVLAFHRAMRTANDAFALPPSHA